MKSLDKDIKKLLECKKKYDKQYVKLRDKIYDMSVSDINNLLMKIKCPYSYDKDVCFQIKEGEEFNSNCTYDKFYEFNCINCKTTSQCYLSWKGKKIFSKSYLLDFFEDIFLKKTVLTFN